MSTSPTVTLPDDALLQILTGPAGAHLETIHAGAGDVLLREGERGSSFLILTDGEADVVRDGRVVSTASRAALLGELALLTGSPRTTTVVVRSPVTALRGSHDEFAALLHHDELRAHFTHVAASRLATNLVPVPFTTPQDYRGVLRPLLPTDRHRYVELIERFGPESRRRRFFSAAPITPRLIDYLLDVDHLNHFAWIALDGDDPDRGLAVGRFVRSTTDHSEAEAAFAVVDDAQGHGLGTILFGAIGVAAQSAGVDTLTAEVLDENSPMRKVFDKAGARWKRVDRGILAATMPAGAVCAVLDPELREALTASMRGLGMTAATALHE
jgi:CRP-like cAMP-binding protein